MASRKGPQIRSALQSKGFRYRESDHTYLTLFVGGKQTSVRTKISHGNTEYGDDLLATVSRQLALTKADLLKLIDCSLGEEKYVRILTDAGRISLSD